jgi:hypothetical protein
MAAPVPEIIHGPPWRQPFLPVVQTDNGVHAACYPIGTGGSFPRDKADVKLSSRLQPVPRSSQVKVKVTLRLTVSQSVCLGVEPKYGTFDQSFFFFWKLQSCHFWGALSDERSGLSCVNLVIEVYSSLSFLQNIYITIYNVEHIYKTIKYLNIFTKVVKYIPYIQASFSLGFVQQIMPYLLVS